MTVMISWFRKKFQSQGERKGGLYAVFDTTDKIIRAAQEIRKSKYTGYDCFTPFPVDGLYEAMGLVKSKLPVITFIFCLAGAVLGFSLQWWIHGSLYPLNFGGKPLFSWPSFIPVTFEIMIFLGGHLTVIAFLILNHLPDKKPKIPDLRLTVDRFALWIPENSNHYNEEEVTLFLKKLEPESIGKIPD